MEGRRGLKRFGEKNQQNREKFKGNWQFSLKTRSAAQKGVGGRIILVHVGSKSKNLMKIIVRLIIMP